MTFDRQSLLKAPLVFIFSVAFLGCTSGETKPSEALTPSPNSKDAASLSDNGETPLAISTVASLISVSDMMVREPERFKKALCSDSNIYDLEFSAGRFSTRAEPLSVCVLFADTKSLKPKGFCGDSRCDSAPVADCSEPEKKELSTGFAKDQSVEKCWNIGNYAPFSFAVIVTRIAQSCQAQTLVKNEKGWRSLASIDGTYETRKSEAGDQQGCWFEAGNGSSFAGDWYSHDKRVIPVMAFDKDGGSYALLKSTWNASENYQLFRLDGDRLIEVESFAEAFKDAPPETIATPAPKVDTPKTEPKASTKKAKKSQKKTKAAPESEVKPATDEPSETVAPTEQAATESNPASNPTEETAPQEPENVPEGGVNPLEGAE